MSKEEFLNQLQQSIKNCQSSMLEDTKKHLLSSVENRLSFAAGYLEQDYEFISEFLDVILSGEVSLPF